MVIYSKHPNFDYTKLKRTEAVEKQYKAHREDLAKDSISLEEYVIDGYFLHPSQQLAITKNSFPYDLPQGQSHWLLWAKSLLVPEEMFENNEKAIEDYIKEVIKTILFFHFDSEKISAIWQNEPEKQSVKGLIHFHFIIQN